MTNSIEEMENTDLILLTGSNTREMHPVISTFMKRGVLSGKTKLIVADPRRIELVDFADIWLRQKPGSDVAWLNGLMHVIIKEDLYDKKYVEERTEDFEALKKGGFDLHPGAGGGNFGYSGGGHHGGGASLCGRPGGRDSLCDGNHPAH